MVVAAAADIIHPSHSTALPYGCSLVPALCPAAAADEEAASLQAQMVSIIQDIGRARDTADLARAERRDALQRELAATQVATDEAERREREFGEQLRAASAGISSLFALLK